MKEILATLKHSEKAADYSIKQLDDEMRHIIGQIRYRLIKLHDHLPESFQGKTSDIMTDLSSLLRLTAILRAQYSVNATPEEFIPEDVSIEIKERFPSLRERVAESTDLSEAMLENRGGSLPGTGCFH